MKKFHFSLAKLKDYREKLLESEKNQLGILRVELVALQDELEQLYALIEAKHRELSEQMALGIGAQRITMMKRYIASKQQEIIVHKSKIAQKEREIEKQLQVVIEKTQDVSTLEKLEEVQLEEYRALEQKENEQFIEEFVSNEDFKKNQRG